MPRVSVPVPPINGIKKLAIQAATQKLFGKEGDNNAEDEIQYRDESRRQRFVNLKISGTPDTYKISLVKDKRSSN